jgi:hypothetical protein
MLIEVLSKIGTIWPAILMGAAIPAGILLLLFFSKARKKVSFKATLFGFASFIAALILCAVILLILANAYLPTIMVSNRSDANGYIYAGGIIALVLFYATSEALKQISYKGIIKSERCEFAGLVFGCGFILAQNLLIFGLAYSSKLTLMDAVAYGILMLVTGLIYLFLSEGGYQLVKEGQWKAAVAMAGTYFLIFAVMLISANRIVSYSVMAIILLTIVPLTFYLKKGGKKKNAD